MKATTTTRVRSIALTILVGLAFAAYLVALVKITLIKGTTVPRLVQDLLDGRAPLRSVNLIPLETIRTYLHYRQDMPFLRWFSNLAGNLLIFVPLGLYLPMLFQRMRRFASACLVIVAISVLLEVLQYLLGTGSTDVDDLLLNTLGGICGYGLFSLIARPATSPGTALMRTLVLSVCFAIAGYTVAYRGFGLYLGLATLREEVQGGESIPTRPADGFGTVTGRGERSLMLTRVAQFEGTPAVDVHFGPDTRFYDRQESLDGHTRTTRYVAYTPRTPDDVPMGALVSVWGRWDGNQLFADVVWTMRMSRARETAPAITIVGQAASGRALPVEEPAMDGHVKGVDGDVVVIYKIEKMTSGSSRLARSTRVEQTFRLSASTTFYKKRILRGGQEVYLQAGGREDLVERASVQAWGRAQNGQFVAEVVCINVFK